MMDTSGKVTRDGTKPAQISLSQENVRDFGNFEFCNGDKYEGQYLAVKQPLSISRDGEGTYWSNQSVYTGKWNRDILDEVDEIIFSDKSIFTGTLENMTLQGPGMYKFKEGIEIQGTLQNNRFVGDVDLKDMNGHSWKAINPLNEDTILFSPVQPFWRSILDVNNSMLPYNQTPSEDE